MKCPKCGSTVRAKVTENSPTVSFEIREEKYNDNTKRSIDFSSAHLDGKNGDFELFCTNPTGICSFAYGFGDIDRHGNITLWDKKKLKNMKGDNL